MQLTNRGYLVLAIASTLALIGIGYVESSGTYCAEMQAAHNTSPNDIDIVQRAWDNGCSFSALPNGEYPYTWTP